MYNEIMTVPNKDLSLKEISCIYIKLLKVVLHRVNTEEKTAILPTQMRHTVRETECFFNFLTFLSSTPELKYYTWSS